MRIFLYLCFFCFCRPVFSQTPVETRQFNASDTIQELTWRKINSDTIFEIFDLQKPPVFPGGENELLKFLTENIYWPKGCGDANITGRIIVQFVIDTTGDWSELKILKTPGKCFEPVVADIFAKMPCWEPGEKDGRVRTRFVLPVRIHWD